MSWGLFFKYLPFILEFLKGFISKSALLIIVVMGIGGFGLIKYVDAKHHEVTEKINTQQSSIQVAMINQNKLTVQQLKNIVQAMKDVKGSVEKVSDKVWELSRDVNRR